MRDDGVIDGVAFGSDVGTKQRDSVWAGGACQVDIAPDRICCIAHAVANKAHTRITEGR